MPLKLEPNLFEPGRRYFQTFTPGDDFYEALIETHRDLTDDQSALVNAKLVLLLSNHIGDLSCARRCVSRAKLFKCFGIFSDPLGSFRSQPSKSSKSTMWPIAARTPSRRSSGIRST